VGAASLAGGAPAPLPFVCTRALTNDLYFWTWRDEVVAKDPGYLRDANLIAYDSAQEKVAGWSLRDVFPSAVEDVLAAAGTTATERVAFAALTIDRDS
jgi:hypothetical protein